MSLPDGLSMRDATSADLPAIAALRLAAGWTVHEWALGVVIGVPHARFVVAVDERDSIVATGSGIVYGPLGFVGNMIVAEPYRRQGVGSAVLVAVTDFLEGAGCVRIELNATSDGRSLYERHGFQSIGRSLTACVPRTERVTRDAVLRVRRAGPDELDALAAYDRARFGGERRSLLAAIVADREAQTLLAERDGTIEGYASVRDDEGGRIGPYLADSPAVAETLLAVAFEIGGAESLRLNLPPDNTEGADWLRGLGLELEPWDGRMARGQPVPKRSETMYGMAVGALG